ncbi:hypothetical protein [Pseudomonas sp. TCU-HL1]|uniref:hypothetical protein n=1 Tax=Pseudomonas sp. TCU-HL1 TaxID=1856685 RepID=UPI0008557DF1|nr:hypothetical protein [Pseudomonas sp. TCU-HL1]AOE86993.1 hypothetical protein THL1_4445 [Pseudomonas sp. TCU-HL1]
MEKGSKISSDTFAWWGISFGLLALGIYLAASSWKAALIVLFASVISNPFIYLRIKEKLRLNKWMNLQVVGTWLLLVSAPFVMYAHQNEIEANRQALLQQQADIAAKKAAELAAQQKKEQEDAERKRVELVAADFKINKGEILSRLDAATQGMDIEAASELIKNYSIVKDPNFTEKENAYYAARAAYEQKLDAERKAKEQAEAKAREIELAKKAKIEAEENYKTRIRSYALDPYTVDQYPKTVAKYKSRLKEIERMRRRAAEMAIDSGKCDYVEAVELSDSRSSLRNIHIWVDCTNQQRFYLSEKEIKDATPVRAESEKAWDTDDARTACRELIKDNATIPSSVDIHVFGSDVYRSQADGRVVITFNFDAKNEYGAEIGYTANCYFEPQRAGTIEVSLRR